MMHRRFKRFAGGGQSNRDEERRGQGHVPTLPEQASDRAKAVMEARRLGLPPPPNPNSMRGRGDEDSILNAPIPAPAPTPAPTPAPSIAPAPAPIAAQPTPITSTATPTVTSPTVTSTMPTSQVSTSPISTTSVPPVGYETQPSIAPTIYSYPAPDYQSRQLQYQSDGTIIDPIFGVPIVYGPGYKKGGRVKATKAKPSKPKKAVAKVSTASKRGDGIAQRGKTRGKFV